jgi:hypothetical protein
MTYLSGSACSAASSSGVPPSQHFWHGEDPAGVRHRDHLAAAEPEPAPGSVDEPCELGSGEQLRSLSGAGARGTTV